MTELEFKKVEMEAKIFRADGSLKSTEKHIVEITEEQYEKLTGGKEPCLK